MAIFIKTQYPKKLNESLDKAISNHEILTWMKDEDGDYTITREQWKFHAWFKLYIEDKKIIFGIIQSQKYEMTRELYAIYHGRLVVTLLSHFDSMIDEINVTSMLKADYDIFES